MQLYVLNRSKVTLATTSDFLDDEHALSLDTGASTYKFSVDKDDDVAQYLVSGNYITFLDDLGTPWLFSILNASATHNKVTVNAEDVGIELLNKAVDVWDFKEAHTFAYYFNLVTQNTPWELGVNELANLNRTLTYTGRDTGLGRLRSVLTGFDNAEAKFRVELSGNRPVKYIVDVYQSIGTVRDNMQLVYNEEVNDITRDESRAEFVTALSGVGGTIQQETTTGDGTQSVDTTPAPEEHIDFADIEYDDGDFFSPKGDKFIYARTANREFNPNDNEVEGETYIEDFYDYDTQSAQELFNRTLARLKKYSQPQWTYEADVKVIDPVLQIGDTVTIIDHDWNPALYLSARVATLKKSYQDPSKNTITFTNYQLLNSSLNDRLNSMQNIINSMPSSSTIAAINSNLATLQNSVAAVKKLVMTASDGMHSLNFDNLPSNAKDGDTGFMPNDEGGYDVYVYDGETGKWVEKAGIATKQQVDNAASTAAQETAVAKAAADSAAVQASNAAAQVSDLETVAKQAKTDAATAQESATNAQTQASGAIAQAQNAQSDATSAINQAKSAQDSAASIKTTVDSLTGEMSTVAKQADVNKLAGEVEDTATAVSQNTKDIKLKADSTTVTGLKSTVDKWSVGGRNYILDSDKFLTDIPASVKASVNSQDFKTSQTGDYFLNKALVVSVQIDIQDVLAVGDNARAGFEPVINTQGSTSYVGTWRSITKDDVGKDIHIRVHQAYAPNDYKAFQSVKLYAQRFTARSVKIGRPKLEIATVDTDWSRAPEDAQSAIDKLGETVTKNSASIDVNSKAITQKADQSTVSSLSKTVETQGASLTTTAQKVEQKADLTVVNTLSGKVDSQAASLTTTANKVEQKADQSTVDTVKKTVTDDSARITTQANQIAGLVTKTDGTNTQVTNLQASVTKVSSTMTSVQNGLNNLQVGGRNYILNSDQCLTSIPKSVTESVNSSDFKTSVTADYLYNQPIVVSVQVDIKNVKAVGDNARIGFEPAIKTAGSTAYVGAWQAITKSDIGKNVHKRIFYKAAPNDYASFQSVKLYSQRFTAESISVGRPKLEIGTAATDWTPAPEDQASVTQLSEFKQTIDSLQGTVTNNQTNTASQVTQLSNQITSTITGVNNLIRGNYLRGTSTHIKVTGANKTNQGSAKYAYDRNIMLGQPVTLSFSVTSSSDGGTFTPQYGTGYPGWSFGAPNYEIKKGWHWYVDTFTMPKDTDKSKDVAIQWRLDNFPQGATFEVADASLVLGSKSPQFWAPNPSENATSSQITQLQSDINLRVKAGDVVNQINIDKSGVLIAGEKVHITGKTTIDDGVITNAMIKNATIDGAKIVDATISSAKIGSIDGGKIVAGSITADKLVAGSLIAGINKELGNNVQIEDGQIVLKSGAGTATMVLAQDGLTFNGLAGITPNADPQGIDIYGNVVFEGSIYGQKASQNGGSGQPHVHFASWQVGGNKGLALVNDLGAGIAILNNGSVWAGTGDNRWKAIAQ